MTGQDVKKTERQTSSTIQRSKGSRVGKGRRGPEGGEETENPDLGPSLFAIPTIFKNASLQTIQKPYTV